MPLLLYRLSQFCELQCSKMASIEAFCSHSPKFTTHKLYESPKPLSLTNPLHNFKPQAVQFQHTKLHFSQKPSLFKTPKTSELPTSKLSEIDSSRPTQKEIFKFLSEKIVLLLVGSFVFMGCFSVRPSLAVSVETSTSSEETRETRKEEESEKLYDMYLEQNPNDVNALKVVMYRKMRSGKTEEAVKLVERLIGLRPDEVEWRLVQALCYETIGHLSKAKRLYKEILEKWPLLLRALHGLAMVMHKNHEGPAVFEMLNEALEMARRQKKVTEERSIRILIAQMHVIKGELEESLAEFQDLIKEDHGDFRPYLCQGIVYSLLDKKEEAEEQFEIYRSLVPKEFPERGYLDDVMMAAKTSSRKDLEKDFKAEFSPK